MKNIPFLLLSLFILLLPLSACRRPSPTPATPSASPTPAATFKPPAPTPTSSPTPLPTPSPSPTPEGLPYPLRAAYYYPYTEADWTSVEGFPRSRFTPQSGQYTTLDQPTIRRHITLMQSGGIQAGILAWPAHAPGLPAQLQALLDAAIGTGFHWTVLIAESDPPFDAGQLAALVETLSSASTRPEFLKHEGQPLFFVQATGPVCDSLSAWHESIAGRFLLAFTDGDGSSACSPQPEAWIPSLSPGQSSAASADAAVIRPGAWPFDSALDAYRDALAWQANIDQYFTPNLKLHIVDSFNNWAAGTAIEPAIEWSHASETGKYLDILGSSLRLDPAVEAVFAGAGDISVCDWPFDDRVADLFRLIPGQIFTLGDNSNEEGTREQYQRCFADSWGRFFDRIHPSPGNHDYVNPGAQAYFEYYGDRAGQPGQGYYSFDLGTWHILSLNGNCSAAGGCWAGSPQETWIREDLAAHPAVCSLAYWHQPRWSSGYHGGSDAYADIWQALYDNGVELVMNGHDHHYERFTPQNPAGEADPAAGIRQFISGTGGATTRWIQDPWPNSEVLHTGTDGLLVLSLHPAAYEWQFIPVGADAFTDWGYSACH